jgi:hypothetical protein
MDEEELKDDLEAEEEEDDEEPEEDEDEDFEGRDIVHEDLP